MSCLRVACALVERHVPIGSPEIAVVLGDLVLENQMVAKRVPGQLGDETVILMVVTAIMREDDVGNRLTLERFEEVLDLCSGVWKESIAEFLDDDLCPCGAIHE